MKHFKEIVQWCCDPRRLFILFIAVLVIPNVVLSFTEPLPLLARISNIVLPMALYWLVMTFNRKPGVMIWILFPIVFFAAFQLVLLYLFGQSIIAVDMFLNLATTNSGEAMELLDNLLPAVIGVFVVYLPTLVLGVVSILGDKKLEPAFIHRQRRYAFLAVGIGVLLTIGSYLNDRDYRIKIDMYPFNVCYNLVLAIDRAEQAAKYKQTSKDFTFHAQSERGSEQPEVYVLVVGETARTCNFGIYGYERNTTPLLKDTKGLVAYPDVLTQSNTTHKSVPMLLSAASAEDYDCIYHQKGVITAFKEAGFQTAFFSNQRPNHSFIDFFGMEADHWKFIRENTPEDANISDDELLKLVDRELQNKHRKLFIVLHTYGSHFNYRERYPEADAVFKPDSLTDAKYTNRASLVNAFDNTIHYTDGFLAKLIQKLKDTNVSSAMLYTSDHGEDIFDDNRKLFLHASPVPSYYQLHVPFLIWMSDAYQQNNPSQYAAVCENREKSVSSNASVFHTILSLGGVKTEYLNDSLSVANKQYTPRQRHYLNDHNLPKPLDKIGLKKEDIEQFHQRHIEYP